jgi:hypothetical protein
MKASQHRFIKLAGSALLLASVVATSFPGVALAERQLKHIRQPIDVELKTALDSTSTPKGTPFEAVVSEDYVFKGNRLPQGTVLKGHVAEVRQSHRFGRPGYLGLRVNEVAYPSGQVLSFKDLGGKKYDEKLHNPDAQSAGGLIGRNLPITAVSLATSIPLQTATDLNGGVVAAIALGARMVTGAVQELVSPTDKTDNAGERIGYGVWRGTGIPTVYNFVRIQPEAAYNPGDTVPMHLAPGHMEQVFESTAD